MTRVMKNIISRFLFLLCILINFVSEMFFSLIIYSILFCFFEMIANLGRKTFKKGTVLNYLKISKNINSFFSQKYQIINNFSSIRLYVGFFRFSYATAAVFFLLFDSFLMLLLLYPLIFYYYLYIYFTFASCPQHLFISRLQFNKQFINTCTHAHKQTKTHRE